LRYSGCDAWEETPPGFATHLQAPCVGFAGQGQVTALEVERMRLARVKRDLVSARNHSAIRIQDQGRKQHLVFPAIFTRRRWREWIEHADAQRLPWDDPQRASEINPNRVLSRSGRWSGLSDGRLKRRLRVARQLCEEKAKQRQPCPPND
jgi:hypothetical protein